ncbi:MAG TPA: glucose-6-phosphate dehydrogenase [Ktedonobacteraceae bacterium]|nr:glucose-6-phosphate dehydrogenase [Ktedonobacteraceae bacterium]
MGQEVQVTTTAAQKPVLKQHEIWEEGHLAHPCAVVIFGATGDLTQRKLLPTLAHLWHDHPLPHPFVIVGFARRQMTLDQWREMALNSVNTYMEENDRMDAEAQQAFAQCLFYCQANFDDPAGYQKLAALLEELDKDHGTAGNRLFYMATPPELDTEVIRHLGASGLSRPVHGNDNGGNNNHDASWTRIIIEKPFGHDLASAQQLNRTLGRAFRENQIYRIDHYMGKETVQNILAFRFSNRMFEPVWNLNYIDNVQILVAESLGIGTRAEYYETSGAIRDMIQNHMMQVLSLTTMEPPDAFDAESIRDEKIKVLRAIPLFTPEEVKQCVVRGQYTAGVIDGQPVQGYKQEKGVAPNSTTETYVALKLYIENWRWAGVPFYLRTGKHLPVRSTEVTIQFKRVPHLLYKPADTKGLKSNLIVIRIQPDEGIAIRFGAKIPGAENHLATVKMDFNYSTAFGIESPDAYERLIADAMEGDSTLFIRRDEIEASWRIVDSITSVWKTMPPDTVYPYPAGSWGPPEAETLIQKDGREWHNP